MEDALRLQLEISQMVTNRLIMINRAKSVSSQPSRPSTSFTNYSGYTSEDTYHSDRYLTPYQDEPQIAESSNTCETGDIVYRALDGIIN